MLLLLSAPVRGETSGAEALAKLKSVGREGAGNEAVARAWKEVVRLGPEALPAVLVAMDDADVTCTNILRTAVDAIAERALAGKQPLPVKPLEQFVLQKQHAGAARRLAYEWLCRVDPRTPDRLLPDMLQDPSAELRRDAVAAAIQEAKTLLDRGNTDAARAAYRKALRGACDRDQVDLITGQLGKLGDKVDVAEHFGFVRQWRLLAPFDNTGGAGFNTPYPPEKGVDPRAVYQGKKGIEARWVAFTTKDPYGAIDLNKALGKQQGVVGYAYAVIESPEEWPVQIRAGTLNALKIFLNGKEVYHVEEYHHGIEMDQYIAKGTLKAGRNELLLKVCQNEQKEDWAQDWGFQVRVCDAVGAAVPFTQALVKTEEIPKRKGDRP
jgi:hypothetical protein